MLRFRSRALGAAALSTALLAGVALAAEPVPTADLPFPPGTPAVTPKAETTPVETADDAADDPAIWIDRADPSRSVIIGTNKQAGLHVYDLSGKILQFVPNGRMNNVDLREGFRLGGREVVLVTASDRTNQAIAILTFDPATRQLTDVTAGLQETNLSDPYGLCMYRSRKSGETYVFISDPTGLVRQWRLVEAPGGKVRAQVVRSFAFHTQVEGCVADDEAGVLYVGEEDVALYRMGAEPDAGERRTVVAAVKDIPALKDDLEGVSLYLQPRGRGYLVLSSQGNNTYAVFRRDGRNAYVGSFAVAPNETAGIDGASETDGLDVTSLPAGPDYPNGLLVVQDGYNVNPSSNQNFKLISWKDVAEKLGLR